MANSRLEALRAIHRTAQDLISLLPPREQPRAPIPAVPDFQIPSPKPLREALLKLGVPNEIATSLNQVYVNEATEYRHKATQELQLLWKDLHIGGSYDAKRSWRAVLLSIEKQARQILDDLQEVVLSVVRLHAKDVPKKRKPQSIFDQVGA